jgi:hypothetical protein
MKNISKYVLIPAVSAFVSLTNSTISLGATLSSSSTDTISTQNTGLIIPGIIVNLPQIKAAVETFLISLGIPIPQNRALREEDFTTIRAAGFAIVCADSQCTQQVRKSNNADIDFKLDKSIRGRYGSVAQLSGILEQVVGTNNLCINGLFQDEMPLGEREKYCKQKVEAANRDGEILVAETNASYYGFVYDGEDGILLEGADEDLGEIRKTIPISEPTSILSLLALGTLGAASTLKRKLKPSQSTEKETTKVS